ncbi:energy transducer TonB [Chelativorans sp. Marseille-P2723]|uniref:energy transducer TonB n=1 Tax=Chelativorans sp. Marseille-P2723 TaxID=2709133 RepID=UPI00156DF796|nr:energy transducer TonB [Chelativorans sp. Marseille-P2723]
MIAWPEKDGINGEVEAEPVEPHQPDPVTDTGPPVEADIFDPDTSSGPLSAAAVPLVRPPVRRGRPVALAFALVVSVTLHGLAVAFFAGTAARTGLEAGSDAISVAIIVQPAPAVLATSPDAAASVAAEMETELSADETTAPEPDLPIEEAGIAADEEPAPITSPEPSPPEAAETAEAVPQEPEAMHPEAVEAGEVPQEESTAAMTLGFSDVAMETPQEDGEELSTVVLPRVNVPTPTPRPARPRQQSPKAAAAQDIPANASSRRQAAPAAGSARAANGITRQTLAPSSGSRGEATAGEEDAYKQRLFRHVARYKRYPREAARQGITGDTSLALTIDRQGRLAGARVARSSGHGILDEEAMAIARRASPYPRLPEGIGGPNYTFTVTLRFSR